MLFSALLSSLNKESKCQIPMMMHTFGTETFISFHSLFFITHSLPYSNRSLMGAYVHPARDYISQHPLPLGMFMWPGCGLWDKNKTDMCNFWVINLKGKELLSLLPIFVSRNVGRVAYLLTKDGSQALRMVHTVRWERLNIYLVWSTFSFLKVTKSTF